MQRRFSLAAVIPLLLSSIVLAESPKSTGPVSAVRRLTDGARFRTGSVLAQIGLGAPARMNLSGRLGGSWKWRLVSGQLTSQHQQRLKEFTRVYDR